LGAVDLAVNCAVWRLKCAGWQLVCVSQLKCATGLAADVRFGC
jgi:hypothetical protein